MKPEIQILKITDTGQALVFSLADTATAELQQRADIPSAITSHNETPNLTTNNSNKPQAFVQTEVKMQNFTAEVTSEESSEISNQKTETLELEPITSESKQNITENTEDIPSFSEWAQKQLEEAEKKKELVNTSSQINNLNGKSTGSGKVRSKNYASLDCGAKIVAANPEAVSSSSVLSSSRDEYMLNACTNRVWFIVELCEAVQAKKIDLANFELFSSLPKEFSIYVSDRFPSRDWLNVGHFTAKEERDVQTFDLHPQLFGKFVKFEMHSHYGSEHFCPISLFRVYGTSEFEVLEKENQAHTPLEEEDDDDEPMDSDNGEAPKNLFSSATDAVISIVKKAAEVLGNKGNNSNYTHDAKLELESSKLRSQCKTPSHIIVCDNCSDVSYDDVYELLSCQSTLLYNLFKCDLIQKTLFNTDTCSEFGLNFRAKRASITKLYNEYIRSFFSKKYLAALCNTAAIVDNKVVLNISKQFPNITNEVPKELHIAETVEPHTVVSNKTEEIKPTEELVIDKIQLETSIPNELNISNTSQIKPTKTLTPHDNLNTHITAESKDDIKTVQPSEYLEENHENSTQLNVDSMELDENVSDFEAVTDNPEDIELINEFNNLASLGGSTNLPPAPNTIPQVKETVILRLSNKIKALERNMSLSSQYLEELSRRYKKQVEEIQKLLDKTIVTLNEEGKKHDDRIRKLEHQINDLTVAVQLLVDEKNSWMATTYWLFLVVVMVCCIFTFCGKKESKQYGIDRESVKVQRRKSIDVVNHNEPAKRLDDLDDVELKKRLRERKRKRKKVIISRSNSIGMLTEEVATHEYAEKAVTSDTILQFRPVYTSSKIWNRQESSPPNFPSWDLGNRIKSSIEDIPFVLEESENSPLESLPLPKPLQAEVNVNGNISQKTKNVPILLKTANESRSKRKTSNGGLANNEKGKSNHRKSGSLDETRHGSPTPSAGTGSLNISYDEVKKVASPKKDRKGAIKRIFKSFS
ncbi:membrane protein ch1 related [Holotrichia oblita]|uniref:Membrane protein ch1 related n=1 Tax=Holotrichia oblita TaxID=644536 RepID=A0ACB9TDL9_HOLOL|nr:membrane protein ch1 related [Holotrichia oblita]